MTTTFRQKSGAALAVLSLCLAQIQTSLQAQPKSFEEGELSSQNLVLPEMEQFRLGARLFAEKDSKIAAWKAFQTYLFNYGDRPLGVDAQFMVAESIFAEACIQLRAGNPPDEQAWKKQKRSGFKKLGKGFKKSLDGLKYIGAAVAGEDSAPAEPDRIDYATFSEAIDQYRSVIDDYKKSGLADTALFRIGECHYNIGDYPSALTIFRSLQKQYPQSYLIGEAVLGAAQCYIPGGDFGSAELEIRKLTTNYPSYQNDPRVQFIVGIIRFQEGKYEEALKSLEKIRSPEALYYSGQALIKMGKGLFATAKFKKVVEDYKDTHFAELAAYLIGESFFQAKNYTGAIQEFRKFLTLYPQSALKEGTLFKIAASHFLKKDYQAARESFNLLINTYPQGEYAALSRYFIAESYRFAQQLKEASFSYGQLISQDPTSPIAANAAFKLGWVTYKQKSYSGAAEAFQKFIDWHPFHPWTPQAYLLMGNCYQQLGRSEDAVIAYQQTFDRAPKTELAEAAMALLNKTRYLQGNYGQLTSGYTYILKALPPSESKWRAASQLYLADSYYRQKLYKEAISVYQSIISLYPNLPAAIQSRDGLSWCYFQLGDYERSQSEREKIQDVRLPEGVAAPTMSSGGYELANALLNQKKYAEAIEIYEKFLRESQDSEKVPEAMYRIGLCYYRQEYYTQAIEVWSGLEQKFPAHERTKEAVFQIADTYFRAQKYDKAVETYRKIIAQYPKDPKIMEATLKIGQSYYNAGGDDKAIEELEAFLKKYPDDPKSVETLDLLEASLDRLESSRGEAQRSKGIVLLKGLVEAFPKSRLAAESQFRIGRRIFGWKNYDKAILEFESVILNYAESPHIGEAQFYAAECYYLLKKYEDAISTFKRFLQNFPGSEFAAAALFHMGTAHYNSQDYNSAIVAYKDLLAQSPDSEFASAALFNLALSQKKLLKLAEAADSYAKLALNYPKDPNAAYAMMEVAKIKKDLNQHGEAILILKDLDAKLPSGDEQKLEIAFLIAESYFANNDPDEAIRSLKSIAALPPQNSAWKLESLRKLGEVYEKQERWAEAAQSYEDGARISGNAQVSASFRERAKYLRETYLGAKPGGSQPSKAKPKTTGGGR